MTISLLKPILTNKMLKSKISFIYIGLKKNSTNSLSVLYKIMLQVLFITTLFSSCANERDKENNKIDNLQSTETVKVFTFNSPNWDKHKMYLTIPDITKEVIDNDLVLGYLNIGILWYSSNGYNLSGYFKSHPSIGEYIIANYTNDGAPNNSPLIIYDVKIIIIKARQNTNKKDISPQQSILNELKEANVNIKNYRQVVEYYNL